jgi:thymidine kinase
MNEDKEIITDGEQIDVGGNEKYISVCRKCYFTKTGHYLYNEIKNNLD